MTVRRQERIFTNAAIRVAKLRGERWAAALAAAVVHGNDREATLRLLAQVEPLAVAAFTLYGLELPRVFNVSSWDYPWHLLRGESSLGSINAPWNVLFQRCFDVAKFQPKTEAT